MENQANYSDHHLPVQLYVIADKNTLYLSRNKRFTVLIGQLRIPAVWSFPTFAEEPLMNRGLRNTPTS